MLIRSAGTAVVLAVILALALSFAPLWAQGTETGKAKPAPAKDGFLADKHKTAGIACSGCHKESPPKAGPSTEACLKCHGPYEKVVSKTEKLERNPHASHLGELDCSNCHHGHKPSVDYCAGCHTFGFKVP